jgi:hypothetical protein
MGISLVEPRSGAVSGMLDWVRAEVEIVVGTVAEDVATLMALRYPMRLPRAQPRGGKPIRAFMAA